MNASKEEAEKAHENLKKIMTLADDCETIGIKALATDVMIFVCSAQRKLPSEAAYHNEKIRNSKTLESN